MPCCILKEVPEVIVPDNLKAAVTRSDRNEPVINDDFLAFPDIMTALSILPCTPSLHGNGDYRAQAAIARLTKNEAFRYKAYPEQIDNAVNRGQERNQMERLTTLDFVHKWQNLFVTGSSWRKAIWPAYWGTR